MFGLGVVVGMIVGGALGSFIVAIAVGGQSGDYLPPNAMDDLDKKE